jgi:subtilisin family serine protease
MQFFHASVSEGSPSAKKTRVENCIRTRVAGNQKHRRRNRLLMPVAAAVTLEQLEERRVLSANSASRELLIQFQDVPEAVRNQTRALVGATLNETITTRSLQEPGYGVLERVTLPENISVTNAISRLSAASCVIFAEPNIRIKSAAESNDPYYTASGSLWGMYGDDTPTPVGPNGTTNIFGSQAEKAWAAGSTGSDNVYVGIIDTGVQITHPDLVDNIWVNPFEIAGDGLDNDGNGYADDIYGWDFFHNDNTVFDAADGDVHGTHVAGTIGAKGQNGSGVAGVNWNVTMIVTKFIGPGGGLLSDAVKAIDYLTDLKVRHGLNVTASNNSWGGGGYSVGLHNAILRAAKADILFIAAAGNSAVNNDRSGSFPANYNTLTGTSGETAATYDSVISVAALASNGSLASFSNYGATTVDIGAPGVAILSTVPDGYGQLSGTSMAAPHVTGAAALYAATHPAAKAADIRRALLGTVTSTTSLATKTVTNGRLNISGALGKAPDVSISINDVQIEEGNFGNRQAVFTVSLATASAATVTVDYATIGGSASTKRDLVPVKGRLTFAPGETSKTISVTITAETIVESDESFSIQLLKPTNAVISKAFGAGTIQNDDQTAQLTITNVTQQETNSGLTPFVFTLSLSAARAEPVKVKWNTTLGTAIKADLTAGKGTVTFAPGVTTQTISVMVKGDAIEEANETFFINLIAPANAILPRLQATGTIVNDDGQSGSQARQSSFAAVAGRLNSSLTTSSPGGVSVDSLRQVTSPFRGAAASRFSSGHLIPLTAAEFGAGVSAAALLLRTDELTLDDVFTELLRRGIL